MKQSITQNLKQSIAAFVLIIAFLLITAFLITPASAAHVELNPTENSYIQSGFPDTNFAPGFAGLFVGNDANGEYRTLVKFNLTPYVGKPITSATLKLYVNTVQGNPGTIEVRNAVSTWTETGVTWNNRPTLNLVEASYDGSTGNWKNMSFTDAVQRITNGSTTNYGWVVVDNTPAGTNYNQILSRVDASKPPILDINYTADLVGSWTFNDSAGLTANDSSGFNPPHNGTVRNTTWSTSLTNGSINGTALSFDGISANVTANSSFGDVNFKNTPFTISIWRDYKGAAGNVQLITLSSTSASNFNAILNDGSDRLRLLFDSPTPGGDISVGSTGLSVSPGWHYIVATHNGGTPSTTNTSLYIDNVLLSSTTGAPTFSPIVANNITIGSDSNADFFNGTIDEVKVYNYVLNSSEITTEFQRFQPVPAYPVAGVTVSALYPPIQTPVTFSWFDTVYPVDELQIAEDSSFNIMVADQFYSTDGATVNLNSGQTYFWRVKQYDSTTGLFGNTSQTQTFSIASPSGVPASGSSIQGIIYEIINGVQTPVSGSTVYLSNSTASFTFVTSSNGYFLFQNLAPNSTYSIYATNAPVYNPTSVIPVTTTATAGTVTSNLLITRFFSPFVPNYVYEKFIVRNLFDTKFPGVTVNVFTDGEITPLDTKVTDSMGQAVFQLIKDTYYRVEFSGGGLSNTIVIYTYGKEEEYEVLVLSGVPTTNVTTSQVSAVLSNSTVNSTFTNLTLLYNDSSLTTTQVNFFVYNNTNGSMTLISYQTFLNNNSIYTGFDVNSGSGNSYVWGYNATNQYGTQSEARGITFPSAVRTTLSSNIQNWISIILLVMLTSMFSRRNTKQGAIIVPAFAFILSAFGWLIVNPIYPAACLILGVLYYMRRQEITIAT